ncbi:hypothetical protein [Massilia niastensis]|uniref:hypothetical protein n=1 Tax=Massilia niastensis TaxID=544911 RepID=UPI0003645942|nr:hypothetical protein [Massilia niastensis]
MSIRDGIYTTVAVAISGVALAGLLGTDAYSRAAGAEARGFDALAMQVQMACAGECEDQQARMVQLRDVEAGR